MLPYRLLLMGYVMKDKIRQARKEAGYTQHELADAIGIHQTQVARWETGKAIPYTSTLAKIAEATGKPVSWFTATDDLMLDLGKELPEKALGKLVKRAQENDRTPAKEAAGILIERLDMES